MFCMIPETRILMSQKEYLRLKAFFSLRKPASQQAHRISPSRRYSKSMRNATGQMGLTTFKVVSSCGLESQLRRGYDMPERTK